MEAAITLTGDQVTLRRTKEDDLPDLLALWNNGAVMRWVGFPEGLGYDLERMRAWHRRVSANPDCFHFCVDAPGVGFCGEAFCALDRAHRRASLDIKFLPRAQGGRRSRDALLTLIRWVFETLSEADAVWTEPHPGNLAARTLYYSCGMREGIRPADMDPGPSYWELRRGPAVS